MVYKSTSHDFDMQKYTTREAWHAWKPIREMSLVYILRAIYYIYAHFQAIMTAFYCVFSINFSQFNCY